MSIELPKKKRLVVSYANMSQELQDAFKEKYPHGYCDYVGNIIKVDRPNGDPFYAVSVDTESATYLVKIEVKTDDKEDIENGLFKDNGDDTSASPDDGELPEGENVGQYASPDEESDE
ncbi:MAG: hypothetical protein LKK19_00690 [Bacteroidales bacterium]|jgi:hypothetical protein|nr:hypothetical protein [Bacteroidales bacterium]MCI2121205.1 hypothetical protein [Bacteroidales bacterium]MCI2146005.1 hypothetical protein [Bacteroidales bacterium]